MKKRTQFLLVGTVLLITLLLAGCTGGDAAQGPVGPQGPAGPPGPSGPPGDDASSAASYVGADRCGQCHLEEYAKYELSGHGNALSSINGSAPELPYDEVTGGVESPPDGYTWDEISYVIGGFHWAALFVDQNGYMITGDETKLVLEHDAVDTKLHWGAFESGEEVLFTCAACHSTGYSTLGNQDGMPGAVGTWQLDGIQCERCHGPGSQHANNPPAYQMTVDRSSQSCGSCHTRDEKATIQAIDGFGNHNQQYNELFNSKHFALSCVACHDPHASAVYEDADVNPTASINQECTACHWQNTERKVTRHNDAYTSCTTCHMPLMDISAAGDLDLRRADVASHQFSINTDPNAAQFSADGKTVMPYLTVEYVCGQCHNGSWASEKDLETLYEFATDYHNPLGSGNP